MRRFLPVAAALVLLLPACSAEINNYQQALDKDREAREKIISALTLMEEAAGIEEKGELSDAEKETVRSKRDEAVNAYNIAVDSWREAEELYKNLIDEYPDDPVYLNNLANLFYNRYEKGLGSDEELKRAGIMLEEALAAHDRPMFRTNLDYIKAATEDEAARERIERNRGIVKNIQKLAEESKQR
jgi:tetratricopeptide (TPR) repeat protein